IKFGRHNPIDVLVEAEVDIARLVVRDRGIGIPLHKLPRIFDRFERAVPSRSYGGLGLGLYIVQGIVRAHEGRIWAESVEGQGSTFTVELPLAGPKKGGAS